MFCDGESKDPSKVVVFFEFRSFRSIEAIAGPEGAFGPLLRPRDKVGRTTTKSSRDIFLAKFSFELRSLRFVRTTERLISD